MANRLYILWSNILIIGMFGRDYGGITITSDPIRSRKRTPTQDLGSPLLDHFIRRHMHRERIRPSTAPPHTDGTSRGWGERAPKKYHSRPAFRILPKRGSPPRASSSVNGCRRQVSGVPFPSLRLRYSGRPLQSTAIIMACQAHENTLHCYQIKCTGQPSRGGDICPHKAKFD
jgi:hypothetical protein